MRNFKVYYLFPNIWGLFSIPSSINFQFSFIIVIKLT